MYFLFFYCYNSLLTYTSATNEEDHKKTDTKRTAEGHRRETSSENHEIKSAFTRML